MSAEMRNRMVQTLAETMSRKQFKGENPGRFFDTVEITLKREQWEKQWKDSYEAVLQNRVIAGSTKGNLPDFPWKTFVKIVSQEAMRKNGKVETAVYVKGNENPSQKLVFEILRAYPKKGGSTGVDIEEKGLAYIKAGTTLFFNSGSFKRVMDKEKLFESDEGKKKGKKYQEFEHGEKREPFFPDDAMDGAQQTIYKDYLNNNPTNAEDYLDAGRKVSGARGTRIQAGIVKAIAKEMTVASQNTSFYDIFFNAVYAKYQDIFNLRTQVETGMKPEQLRKELIIRGELIPVLDGNAGGSRWNSGKMDIAIRQHYENFLTDEPTFVKEVQRLMGLPLKEAQQLFMDSPGYIEEGSLHSAKLMIQRLFPKHKSKPNMRYRLNKDLVKTLGTKTKKGKESSSKPSGKMTQKATRKKGKNIRVSTAALSRSVMSRGRLAKKAQSNPMALKNLINSMLPQVVAMKMQEPNLRFRTGRFANSARMTNVTVGPKGGLQGDYTYMRSPYETFEPGGKMGSTQRDPRRIIGASIREIVSTQMQGRFIKVRRV